MMRRENRTEMKIAQRPCPLCGCREVLPVANLEFGDFDSSSFDRRVVLVACRQCGQAFNDLSLNQGALEQYYRDEALYAAEMGVGSGGSGPCDQKRYADTAARLAPVLPGKDAAIVDVGCAKGGFLAFLRDQGYTNLAGIDLNRDCVAYVQDTWGIPARVGTVHHLPHADGTAACLVYSHIFEHLDQPVAALQEARRVLRDDGLLFLEVPDATRYAGYPVFDFYWLSQKEHINHFDAVHLSRLAEAAGFHPLEVGPMIMEMAPGVENPLIYGVFQKQNPAPASRPRFEFEPGLYQALQSYVQGEDRRLAPRRELLAALAASGRAVYAWGIGLEFFCLYVQAGLKDCNLRYLVDKNPAKRQQTVEGCPIHPPECFAGAPTEAVAVLTSALHCGGMAAYLQDLGFPGEVLQLA